LQQKESIMSQISQGASPIRYVSGIRPTGSIHLGNYLGAIRQWKRLQDEAECLFFVADLHGVHSEYEIFGTVGTLLRAGIRQVQVQSGFDKAHLALHANLQHYSTIGQLSRMTQYKAKAEKEAETAALLTYPVLMAADIFHNGGTHVPVGNDQVQHIEFARDLFDRAHEALGLKVKPQAVVSEYPRIMSLTDGSRKMSKSDLDDMSRINVTDDADTIRKKVISAKSSMNPQDETPEARNLRMIYRAVGGKRAHDRWKPFKEELVELLVAELGV
jgi:tryptophanyl-tRNA synthetase